MASDLWSPSLASHEKNQSVFDFNDPERSDPTVNIHPLDDNHPIHLLSEAQKYYVNGRTPPFVLNKRSEMNKRVVIPTKAGLRPKDEKAVKVPIVAKPWDKNYMFWTLDLNGKRYIVKPFNGGAQGGMRYLHWAGPDKFFNQTPLALSFISSAQSGATTEKRKSTLLDESSFVAVNGKRFSPTDDSDSSDSSDPSDSEVQKERGVTGPLAHRSSASQDPPAKRTKLEISSREMDQLYHVTPPAPRRSDVRAEPAQSPTSTPKPSGNDREEMRKQRAKAQIERRLDRSFDQIFTPWAGEDQDVSRNTLQIILKVITLMEDNTSQKIVRDLNRALNGGDGRREPAGGKKPTRPYFKGLVASLQNNKSTAIQGGGLQAPLSLSESMHQQLGSRNPQGANGVSAQSVRPDPRSRPSENNDHQLDRMFLPPEKQTRTTLIVRVAPSLEFLPLKLSECMTSEAFYSKVLGAWEVPRESLAKVTVTFTWMDARDTMRTMVMNSQVEGCFTHLIEQVDEAPSWTEAPDGRGKCQLDVNIIRKE